jgi:cell division transport system ATP-binding protein
MTNKPVLAECSMSLLTGDFCYLLGPTGSGKSSILKLFYRAVKPTKGDVRLHGKTIQTLPNRKTPYIRRQIGVVFQDFQLLQDRNVFENIAFALRVTGTLLLDSLTKKRSLSMFYQVVSNKGFPLQEP